MSITTYSELQTAVANWVKREDLTSIIPDLILLGELRIWRIVRARQMEKALSVAISAGVATVPTDYVELKSAYLDSSPTRKLSRATASQVYEQYPNRTAESKPRMIAREGSNFIFGPYPDGSYNVKGIYYARLTSIQSSANALFLAFPDLYLMAALCETASYTKNDSQIMTWEGKFAQVVKDINDEATGEDSSGGGLSVRAA